MTQQQPSWLEQVDANRAHLNAARHHADRLRECADAGNPKAACLLAGTMVDIQATLYRLADLGAN